MAADRASREFVGEAYYLQYNEAQKWYWISGQTEEELMVFVNWDSDSVEVKGLGTKCRLIVGLVV